MELLGETNLNRQLTKTIIKIKIKPSETYEKSNLVKTFDIPKMRNFYNYNFIVIKLYNYIIIVSLKINTLRMCVR